MDFTIVIPARFDSKRLPGKVLLDIAGKPMVQHVYEHALEAGASTVVIATDSEKVQAACEAFGAPVIMTDDEHMSGTERVGEVVDALEMEDDELVVCLQADEPLLPAKLISELVQDMFEREHVKVGSVCAPMTKVEDVFNPNVVKVVLNRRSNALYFSRAPIPWSREGFANPESPDMSGQFFRHIGVYAYKASFLKDYLNWEPSVIEEMESLEQLRILSHGGRIHMLVTQLEVPLGVDTKEDFERVLTEFA